MGNKQHPKDKKKQAQKKKANKSTTTGIPAKRTQTVRKKGTGQAIATRFLEKQSNETLRIIIERKLNGWETAEKIIKKRTAS